MTKKLINITFLVLTLLLTHDIFSQTIYFSVTGDTVCYVDAFGFEIDSSHIGQTAYIKKRIPNGEPLTISSFTIKCKTSNTCQESFPKDTIKKYNLQLDGSDNVWDSKTDFVVSVKPTHTKVIDTSAFGPKYIYITTVHILIGCKGQKLYAKYFDIMFKGNSPSDFPEKDIVRIKAWRKKNTKKYFVDLNVKEHQVFKKPTDTEESNFKSLQFIL